ncbi:MAG: TIGR02186 family protein [Pseudomonadota bacterium]
MRFLIVPLTGLLIILAVAFPASHGSADDDAMTPADELVIDLAPRQIDIRAQFSGAEMLIFAAIDPEILGGSASEAPRKADVVIAVRGPARDTVVRRKERRFGIWVNATSVTFADVAGFYALLTNRPLSDISDGATGIIEKLGLSDLINGDETGEQDPEREAFHDGLIREMRKSGLHLVDEMGVEVMGGRLIRAGFTVPAAVPVGLFEAEVLVFVDGALAARGTVDLDVGKIGIERAVYDFAQTRPALYGIVAVIIALLAGWFAGSVSGKR